MNRDQDTLATTLQKALEVIAAQNEEQVHGAIAPIVMTNLDRGRIHYFLDSLDHCQPADYVGRVLTFYKKWQPYLYQIQEEQHTETWLELYEKLKRWAYNYLSKKQFPPDRKERMQLATDCATMAAARLLNARFPYDTDFDPWAHTLLQHVTLKHLHKAYEEASDNLYQIEDWEKWEGVWPQLSLAGEQEKTVLRQSLLAAIDQLASDARKQLILMRYFEGKNFQEIATEMGRSITAVHKLHFDALENLRKIWASSRDNDE